MNKTVKKVTTTEIYLSNKSDYSGKVKIRNDEFQKVKIKHQFFGDLELYSKNEIDNVIEMLETAKSYIDG